ncbi:MAG TPA: hypothetical protein VEQ10_03155 [Vicinamibacteria bacterium]|nr:hypothetical protein [Vicinamibacteria bacterium]
MTGRDTTLVRHAAGIAVAMVAAVALSWIRFGIGGTLNVRDLGLAHDALLGLAFAAVFATAALLYLKVLSRIEGPATPSLLGLAVLVHLAASPALPLTSNDVFPNLAYGRLATLGHNPSTSSPADLGADDPFGQLVDPMWRGQVSVYGPLLNGISRLCARTGRPASAVVLFKLVALGAALSTLLVCYGYCRTQGTRGAFAFWLIGTNPLLAWELSGQAHNDGVMLLATACFLWAAATARHWIALLCLAVGVAAKFAVAPLLLLYLLWVLRRSPARGAAMATVAATVVVALFAPGWGGPTTLAGPRFAVVPSSGHVANSLASLPLDLARSFLPAAHVPLFLAWTVAASAFLAVQALRCARRTATLEDTVCSALVFILVYECIGMVWYQPWYATWLLPLAAACRDRRLAAIAVVYSVLVPLLYGATMLFGLAALASHGLALWLLWRIGALDPRPRRSVPVPELVLTA